MEFEIMKKSLDETLDSLIGQKIISVQYATIDYFDENAYWDFGKIHEVEHGVELTTETDEIYRISWDKYDNDYGVYIAKKDFKLFWIEAVMWNVNERAEWKNILSQSIKEIKTYWHEWNNGINLQDIEFEFPNNSKIWFSSSRYDSKKDQLLGGSDDISIIFEEPIAFKYERGSFTKEKNFKVEIYK